MDVIEIKKIAMRMASKVKTYKKRFAYWKIKERLFKDQRVKILRGLRGTGKTTILLQLFLEVDNSIYIPADNPRIKKLDLYDLLSYLVEKAGVNTLLIDEIHKIPEWRSIIKAVNDEFPDVRIVCSGSSPLALYPDRREEIIDLLPMSFSEFVFLKTGERISASDEWKSIEKSIKLIAEKPWLESAFEEYLKVGGFPFSLEYSLEGSINSIFSSIIRSVREDSVFYGKMSPEKVYAMEKILYILASLPPFDLSINSLASMLGVSKTVLYNILELLQNMQIIRKISVKPVSSASFRNEPKLLFFHPNIRYAIAKVIGAEPNVGAIREDLFVFSSLLRGFKVYTVKGRRKNPDYLLENSENIVVEVGGKGKSKRQIKGLEKAAVMRPEQLLVYSLV